MSLYFFCSIFMDVAFTRIFLYPKVRFFIKLSLCCPVYAMARHFQSGVHMWRVVAPPQSNAHSRKKFSKIPSIPQIRVQTKNHANPLKPAPTLRPKTMTVQKLYHDVFFIWQLIPPSRTLLQYPRKLSGKFFDRLLCEPCAKAHIRTHV